MTAYQRHLNAWARDRFAESHWSGEYLHDPTRDAVLTISFYPGESSDAGTWYDEHMRAELQVPGEPIEHMAGIPDSGNMLTLWFTEYADGSGYGFARLLQEIIDAEPADLPVLHSGGVIPRPGPVEVELQPGETVRPWMVDDGA